jgi:hypothetical protein
MARIETDPNYTSPTFSRATAGTDLFKKEDVQALAAALSTHVHDGAGKGLAVAFTGTPPGSIPGSALADGSVTSAKIADGTIATVDIGLNQCQQNVAIGGGVLTFSTTTTASWVSTPLTATFTSAVGGLMRIEATVTAGHSVANGNFYVALGYDGGVPPTIANLVYSSAANTNVTTTLIAYTSLAAGSHSVTVYVFNNTAGTCALNAATTQLLYVTEQKR